MDISNDKTLLEKLRISVIYISISGFATLLDVGLLIVFIEILHLWYMISATFSYLTGMITKFTLNKFFVFHKRPGNWSKQLRKFATVSINGMILTNIFMFIGVDLLEQSYLYTKLVIIGIIFIYTLTLHNYFSFSKKG
ncbi:MAG: GtrA family protein [Candidatus Kariarchaeaceae archaeon]|jgi:putative flippase GtrA